FHDTEMNYEIMADDLLHFIWQHNINKVTILGHSMGGKVAMWFALNHSDYIDKLIIVDIAPVNYVHSFDKTINALKNLPLAELKNRKQAEEFLASAIPELSYRQFLLQNLILKNGAYCWRVNLDIFANNADYIIGFPETNHISPCMKKALFIAGEQSHYIKQGQFETLFPNAQLKIIANAAHWLHVQQPEAFILAVIQFLEQI
ncbi:partial Esterase YbfF, partial [Methylococcales bacterium]